MNDEELLELAAGVVPRAAAVILEIRARGFEVSRKADRSVVTEADRASEAIITAALRQAAPEIPVVAEEAMADGAAPVASACFWLVDPLDGTREFTDGGDDFAVNIGLVRNRRVVLGVVGVPATGEVFGGIVGRGAWKRHGGSETAVCARSAPPEGLTVLASRHHGDVARLDAYLAGRVVAKTLNFGSSLKFCRLAEGIADLYPRFGRTMEWDTAAPQAVLEAAGGTVRTLDGATLGYGKPGWDNPFFVCTGVPDGVSRP